MPMMPSSLFAAVSMSMALITGAFLGIKLHVNLTRCPCLAHRAKSLRIGFIAFHILSAAFTIVAACYHIYDTKCYKAITLKSLLNAGWWSFIMMLLEVATGVGILLLPVLVKRCRGKFKPPRYFRVMKSLHALLALAIAVGIFFFHVMEHEIYIRLK